MREFSRAVLCTIAGTIFSCFMFTVSADERWTCERISGLAEAFSDSEKYLNFLWIHFVGDIPTSVLVDCVDTGVLGPNGRDEEGWSVLHWAVIRNELEIVTALLAAGADPNARTKEGTTPMHTAAYAWDNPAVVRELLKAGAAVDARNEGGATPLHNAVSAGNAATLLKAGADVNARTKDGSIPLHFAAFRGEPAVIAELLKAGSELNARTQDGLTPLHLAAMVTTRASYRRRDPRGRFGWRREGCIPGWPWTGDSSRFGNRRRRTCGYGSIPRLSA